ncbi:MAG: response regulator [Desulfobacterales bacterium]|nr:response regulator [Desulfobacterales bacterium]
MKKRILIIDDEEQIRKMLSLMLTNEGYDVEVASNGNEGILCYQKHPADLIMIDIIMPEKEGIETIRELIKDYPSVKIIAMSGGGRVDPDAYLHLAKYMGASKCFSKPIDKPVLLQAIQELLKSDANM